ncbi:MAG: LLM class flavin-dependent oxidoreductase [Rhodospirillaceae bacterium]|jgi:alkanesulfonate monooxygenase SsuD/methylene tetrahydromethanopterin reductase-like flavin-dependent oxidoreductase (luciferase family)|nr:LLM class flavin-dependent oxidoreductase [Rhodospirillaceae bacterium]MBT4490520.1 LLM class flavin-dependent oxidoreductase [Rhodospirillaceae bacterium]MBT5194206.1 LLM class flavin-dependent oxidoreductase [Rhodospirillaceae bacterium]MBT5894265.1 LLM class flavin-dependent oxidoreductase [Rhodospirillaceae bacterium]MBT6427059.1 LLM class flavin-dependent oxidoreductase [Rhodospirillaceae bacterium]
MTVKLGYLLPTRERVMHGQPEAAPILDLADRAEDMGFDSVWIGDSILARPRHDPITMLAAIAGRTSKVELGTAVLLPALRNPVVLAHQFATLDQISQGRIILGVGIAGDVPNIRAEFASVGVPFEKRVGRMMEGLRLCQAFWRGEPVDWDGRWPVEQGVLAPTPYRPGGPPIWGGGSAPAGLARAGKYFDGWFPTGPDAAGWAKDWQIVKDAARDAGRDPDDLTGALYLTMVIDDDAAKAQQQIETYLEEYYGVAAAILAKRQACYAGPAEGAAEWLKGYADAGASHLVLRFAGDNERHMDAIADIRGSLGW